MLAASKRVNELWENDEFKIFIVQGDHGYGKTTYANKIISEVYSKDGIHRNWSIPLFKTHIGYHPKYVYDLWIAKTKRDKVFHWDDSGSWLNSMDYQDPFVKEVGKYMQTARTDWACIIFSCIDREDIVNKIRSLRHAIIIDITKNSSKSHPDRRLATAVTFWKSRTGKIGFNYEWEENFDCKVPGTANDPKTFYGWYDPLRKEYSKISKKLGREKLEKKKDIMKYVPEIHM